MPPTPISTFRPTGNAAVLNPFNDVLPPPAKAVTSIGFITLSSVVAGVPPPDPDGVGGTVIGEAIALPEL